MNLVMLSLPLATFTLILASTAGKDDETKFKVIFYKKTRGSDKKIENIRRKTIIDSHNKLQDYRNGRLLYRTKPKNAIQQTPTPKALPLNTSEHTKNNTCKAFVLPTTDRGMSKTSNEFMPRDNDFYEAEMFGLQKMKELSIDERKLYTLGLFLETDNPAHHVATFNKESKEAKRLAAFAYAALKGSTMLQQRYPNVLIGMPFSRRSTHTSAFNDQCPRRGTPQCLPASLKYRTSDGSCNNFRKLWWGSALSTMKRFLPPVYNDEIQEIRRSVRGHALPSPRIISNIIHQDRDMPSATVSHMLMQWGQFIDHDMVATAQSSGFNGTFPRCCSGNGVHFQSPEFMHPDCSPIPVDPNDSFFGPLGIRCLEFVRSSPAPKENCEFGPREQLSQVTSFLDASMVYSSNAQNMDSLRFFHKGMLQHATVDAVDFTCRQGFVSTQCLKAGDGRLSEQPALVSMHIVFVRLHNRIANNLAELNPHWSDEKLFQESRRIVGALVQLITYREFLPVVLGPDIMKIFDLELERDGYYDGYDDTVEPNIANSFASAAYRFGHSLVQQSFLRVDIHHRPIFKNVTIHNELKNSANLHTPGSLDRLLLGLVDQPCQKRDEFITDELTNHLFQTPGFKFGMDLASINIQRGRDHGLSSYPAWRITCGLSPIRTWTDFDRVTSLSAGRKFRQIYAAVDDIDLFSAGLAEKPVLGGLIGPTFACIIAQQFSNLRKGDRFWFENSGQKNSFRITQLKQIKKVTLAQILCHTTNMIETIQPFVFLTADTLKNQRISCDDPAIGRLDLNAWTEIIPK